VTAISTLDAEQQEIRDVARRFLEEQHPSARVREVMESEDGIDRDAWNALVQLGWTGVGLPESDGGAGYGAVGRALLLEEMGRVLSPVPYLSSAVFARDVLFEIRRTGQADDLLTPWLQGVLALRSSVAAIYILVPAFTVTSTPIGMGPT
jgi:alkylation response protein AidB-like acyl-CoA dehydrogenase